MKRPKRYFMADVGTKEWHGHLKVVIWATDSSAWTALYVFNCETREVMYSRLSLVQLAHLERRHGKDRDEQAASWDRYRSWKEQARARRKAMAARKLAAGLSAKQLGTGQRILSSHRKAA